MGPNPEGWEGREMGQDPEWWWGGRAGLGSDLEQWGGGGIDRGLSPSGGDGRVWMHPVWRRGHGAGHGGQVKQSQTLSGGREGS